MPKRAEGEERAAQAHAVPKRRGRPVTREIKLDATPEEVARCDVRGGEAAGPEQAGSTNWITAP